MLCFIINSISVANSFASDSLYNEKYQIYDIKGGNLAGTSSGCPSGYNVSGELEDECVGTGPVEATCPKGLILAYNTRSESYDQCSSEGFVKKENCPNGYFWGSMYNPRADTQPCSGPAIFVVNCPTGFENRVPDTSPPDPKTKLCVGPRQ
jgi:hypothetical protein